MDDDYIFFVIGHCENETKDLQSQRSQRVLCLDFLLNQVAGHH